MAKTAQISKTVNEMRSLIDNGFIGEVVNERLELLQEKLASQCRVQVVKKRMTSEEMEKIIDSVRW